MCHHRPPRYIQPRIARSASQFQPLSTEVTATIDLTIPSIIPMTALVPNTLVPDDRHNLITTWHLTTAITMVQAQNLVGRVLSRVPLPPLCLQARTRVLDMTSRLQNLDVWTACCTGLVAGFRALSSVQSFALDEE
jgi:hypothetical protein